MIMMMMMTTTAMRRTRLYGLLNNTCSCRVAQHGLLPCHVPFAHFLVRGGADCLLLEVSTANRVREPVVRPLAAILRRPIRARCD